MNEISDRHDLMAYFIVDILDLVSRYFGLEREVDELFASQSPFETLVAYINQFLMAGSQYLHVENHNGVLFFDILGIDRVEEVEIIHGETTCVFPILYLRHQIIIPRAYPRESQSKVGFYDSRSRVIGIMEEQIKEIAGMMGIIGYRPERLLALIQREGTPESLTEGMIQELIVHEATHALVDQSFPRLSRASNHFLSETPSISLKDFGSVSWLSNDVFRPIQLYEACSVGTGLANVKRHGPVHAAAQFMGSDSESDADYEFANVFLLEAILGISGIEEELRGKVRSAVNDVGQFHWDDMDTILSHPAFSTDNVRKIGRAMWSYAYYVLMRTEENLDL